MATTDLTTTSSVRAALGVSERELRDEVLSNPIYATLLNEAIFGLSDTLFDDFVTTAAIAEASRTRTQQRFVDLTQTFSAYHIGVQCLGTVAMFAPKTIKDSRSELSRNDDPYKNLRTDLPAALALLRQSLLNVYSLINPSAVVTAKVARVLVTAAPLGVNPVTG